MPEASTRVQYYHLRKQLTLRDLKRLAYQRDNVDSRGFRPFEEPKTMTAQITGEHIPGAILRIPGQHPTDTRWGCKDPEFAFNLELRDESWTQGEMRASDDKNVTDIKEIPHEQY